MTAQKGWLVGCKSVEGSHPFKFSSWSQYLGANKFDTACLEELSNTHWYVMQEKIVKATPDSLSIR